MFYIATFAFRLPAAMVFWEVWTFFTHYSTPFVHFLVSRAFWLVSLTALSLLVLMATLHQGSSLSLSIRSCSLSSVRQKPEPQSATYLSAFLHLELCTSAFSAFSPGDMQWICLLWETLNDRSSKKYKAAWWYIRQNYPFHAFIPHLISQLEFLGTCYFP